MESINNELINIANNLPKNASWEDAMYEIYVRKKISEGLEAAKRGEVISHEEVMKKARELIFNK